MYNTKEFVCYGFSPAHWQGDNKGVGGLPQRRPVKKRPVRRSSSGDVFVPVIILLLGIIVLSMVLAFAWQKWQDVYDPDYLYPDKNSSSQSSSEPESSSQAQPSSQPEQSSESSSSGAQVEFGVPVPESERVRSDYFNDAVFIGDSLTTGIELYNILPDTTVLASTGINLDTIDSKQVIGTGDSKLTIPDALRQTSNVGKIYIMLGANGLGGLGAEKTTELYRSFIQEVQSIKPDAVIYVQSILPINEEKFKANYGYALTNEEINKCNEELLEMTRDMQVYYVDVASAIRDENGGLPAEFTSDGLHFKAEYYNKWIDYLKEHTVTQES